MGTFKQIPTKDTKYENISKYLLVYVKDEKEHKFFSNSPVKEITDNGAIYNIAILNTLNQFNNEDILNYMFVTRHIAIVGLNTCFDFMVITNKELSYEFLLNMNNMLHDEEEKAKNFLKMH